MKSGKNFYKKMNLILRSFFKSVRKEIPMKASLKKLLFISLFGLLISFNACSGGGDGGGGSATPPATEFGGTTPPPSSPPPPSGPGPLSPPMGPPGSDLTGDEGLSALPGATGGTSPVVAIDPTTGNPVVAWIENDAPGSSVSKVYCWSWNGREWIHLGNGIRAGIGSIEPNSLSLALTSTGQPVLAWSEDDGSNPGGPMSNIYVRRWDTGTSSWQNYGTDFLSAYPTQATTPGGMPTFVTPTSHPSLALYPSDYPIVAWEELTVDGQKVFVKQWTGTAWEDSDSAPLTDPPFLTITLGPSLVVRGSGNPVLTYAGLDGIRVYSLVARHWTSYAGIPLKALGTESEHARFPSVKVDSSNNPILVWWESSIRDSMGIRSPENIYARKWNSGTWNNIGPDSGKVSNIMQIFDTILGVRTEVGDAFMFQNNLVLDNDQNPIVSWGQNSDGTHIRHWNGREWQNLTGTPIPPRASYSSLGIGYPSMAFDGGNNAVVVVWSELRGPAPVIYVRRIPL